MNAKRIGIIGGSGFYDVSGMPLLERLRIATPFGDPSDEIAVAESGGREICFIPRHGRRHQLLPGEINYRANIHALKQLNVGWILSLSAVGSFKKEIKPLDIVLVDQFVDRTTQRRTSFFGEGLAAHIPFAEPICQNLRRILYESGQEEGVGDRIHWGGTYLNIEGPAFSSKAESRIHQAWGCDVVGMTNVVEAKLAREAEICYATMAMVTDYDSWQTDAGSNVSAQIVIDNLKKGVSISQKIMRRAVQKIPLDEICDCHESLKGAIVTESEFIPQATKDKLALLIRNHLAST
jgi:5'-methylthioadenosine phosphorylase